MTPTPRRARRGLSRLTGIAPVSPPAEAEVAKDFSGSARSTECSMFRTRTRRTTALGSQTEAPRATYLSRIAKDNLHPRAGPHCDLRGLPTPMGPTALQYYRVHTMCSMSCVFAGRSTHPPAAFRPESVHGWGPRPEPSTWRSRRVDGGLSRWTIRIRGAMASGD